MPRKGVPYGGAICSLKERIAELFDLVGEKLHSINGVQGDGQGNVKLISGDPAVVITNDAAQNEIEIALDNSKLPSAAVSSVNGQTGAVVLNAGNIPTRGNANVQTDIDVGKAGLQDCIANIITEREARENGDAALQANINAVQGAVQADYVKKTGSAQTVTSQIMVPTTATGTRDTQIANGTRIQNDLDAYQPMIRDTGNKNVYGEKKFINGLLGQYFNGGSSLSGSDRWFYIEYAGVRAQFLKFWVADYINNNTSRIVEGVMFWNGSAASANTFVKVMGPAYSAIGDNVKVTIDSNNNFRTWFYVRAYHSFIMNVEAARSWASNIVASYGYVDNPDWSEYATVKSGVLV